MNYNLYSVIKKKNIDVVEDILAINKNKSCVIYLNPFTYIKFRKNFPEIIDIDGIRFDGIFFRSILSVCMPGIKFVRQSFDMTSLAPKVFQYALNHNKNVFIAGGKPGEVEAFSNKIRDNYPGLNIVDYCDGYQAEDVIIERALGSGADIYLFGLGNVKQERVALSISKIIDNGLVFTCGAFITQTVSSKKLTYYPEFVNKMELRWLFRIIKEKHVLGRVVKFYPMFVLYFIYDMLVNCLAKR